MKKLLTLSLSLACLLLTMTELTAQAAPQRIALEDYDLSVKTNFTCAGVIDRRIVKSNIGFMRVGLEKRKTLIWLEGNLTEVIHNHINDMIVPSESAEEIFIIVNEVNVEEHWIPYSEQAICNVEIEFVQKVDATYYSLGIYFATTEEYGLDVTKFHGVSISKCLQKCINDFVQSDWLRNAERIEIDINEPAPSYDYKSVPPAGGYDTFVNLVKNNPMESFDFTLLPKNLNPELQRYKLKDDKTKYEAGIVNFISDGTSLYISASAYTESKYYLKAKQLGRYIYFEDQFSDKGTTYSFGLIGAALSNQLRGLVLDTANGEISVLNKYQMLFLLKDYPDIKEAFEKSKMGKSEIEGTMMSLNRKFED